MKHCTLRLSLQGVDELVVGVSAELNTIFGGINVVQINTGSPLFTLFFETLEKQLCKQKTV